TPPTITRVEVAGSGQGGSTLAGAVAPDGTPSPVYDSDLLSSISREDIANTDVHVFGPAGDLITTRIGLRPNESPGLGCDQNKQCQVTPTDPGGNPVATTIQDFIRNRYPGARYKIVVVNRSTGYIGTGYVSIGSPPSATSPSGTSAGAISGFDITAADGGPI